jgi:uncharacterized protein (TIGR00255 family)
MTGFGAASGPTTAGVLSVELRSVNSRHLKLHFRLPPGTDRWEESLRQIVGSELKRGHVEVTLRLEPGDEAGRGEGAVSAFRLDEPRLQAYLAALRTLKDSYGLEGEIDLAMVGRCDRLLREEAADLLELVPVGQVEECAREAIAQLLAMRRREGERLAADLVSRLGAIDGYLAEVEERAPARLVTERDRLRRSVADLADGGEIEADRLAREIAILADRWDISEELVRARSHLEAFDELMAGPEDEPVGKRLGFLSQELLRELNTVGAKANDAEISRSVVEAKNELESMREQIENVE